MIKNCNFSFLNKILLLSGAILLSSSAMSAQSTTTMTVTANVEKACTIAANNIPFGSYTLSAITLTTTIVATCTAGTTFTIGIDAGANAGGATNYANRAMKISNGTNLLSYQLYTDSNRQTVWNNTSGGNSGSYTGTGAAQNINIYSLVPANQTALIGSYSDTANVYINF